MQSSKPNGSLPVLILHGFFVMCLPADHSLRGAVLGFLSSSLIFSIQLLSLSVSGEGPFATEASGISLVSSSLQSLETWHWDL